MPDEEALVQYMCTENNFSEDRIRGSIKKLVKAKGTATQGRLDSFFTVVPGNGAAKRKVLSDTGCGLLSVELSFNTESLPPALHGVYPTASILSWLLSWLGVLCLVP